MLNIPGRNNNNTGTTGTNDDINQRMEEARLQILCNLDKQCAEIYPITENSLMKDDEKKTND